MTIRISDIEIALTVYEKIVVTARCAKHPAAVGNCVWIVSTCEARLFNCNQAVAALSLPERPTRPRWNRACGGRSAEPPVVL
jgi:hypothetical protein